MRLEIFARSKDMVAAIHHSRPIMQNEILPIAAERFLFNRRHVCVLVSFNGQNFNEIVDTFLIGKKICNRKVCTGM